MKTRQNIDTESSRMSSEPEWGQYIQQTKKFITVEMSWQSSHKLQ